MLVSDALLVEPARGSVEAKSVGSEITAGSTCTSASLIDPSSNVSVVRWKTPTTEVLVLMDDTFERSDDRTNQRNGTRSRVLTTMAGDLNLKIPKLRQGSFVPAFLERRRRVDQALFAVVMEAYLHGVSTRKVKALGADTGISKSEVSRICADLDGEVATFRDRDLGVQRRGLGDGFVVIDASQLNYTLAFPVTDELHAIA